VDILAAGNRIRHPHPPSRHRHPARSPALAAKPWHHAAMLLVFGSINLDLAFRAPHLPAPGETVLGHGLLVSPGGKGANQAHAARRYGMPTALVGAVGQDAFAAPALAALKAAGVNLSALQVLPGATGCASIAVDDAGQIQIVGTRRQPGP
jgi:ribokinase